MAVSRVVLLRECPLRELRLYAREPIGRIACEFLTLFYVVATDGVTVFCNLAEDESLFTGKGDYQFDVYRLMKKSNK